MERHLIEPEALDLLVKANGGLPSRLVSLMQRAALYALERDAKAISATDAFEAIADLRRELQAPLTSQELAVLKRCHRDPARRLTNDEDERRLLQKGALIDYSNGETWCDAHPALWSLLERDDDDDTDESA
jgi:hypothetical protein